MQRLAPKPPRRRSVSERVRRLVTYAWILAAVAIPIGGVALISEGAQLLAPGDPFTYQVNTGDTLTSIALRYGVSVDAILGANGLSNPDVIYVGQQLVIPVPDASGQQVHTVQAGESLSMIAHRYNVTVDEIVSTNGLVDRNRISVGQRLVIPGGEVPQAAAITAVTYTVQRGDSLYRIALIFGISVDDLLAVNDLAGTNSIYPGLELRIPIPGQTIAAAGPGEASAGEPQTGGLTYTVRLGDTLYGIAIAQGVTVDGIVAANALSRADQIYVGQVLNLPEAGQTARPAPAQTAVSHRVVQGQTLYEIALRYGVTISALAAANGINNPAQIVVGQVLSIPSAQAGSSSIAYASQGDGLCANVELQGTGTGYFIRSVRGYVITQQFFPWHSGIDLALDSGSPVFSADSGTVIFAGWNPVGYGNLIVLDHGNGWRTYYAHLSQINVSCGDWIPRGSIIAASGSTGNSTGPHLHFEMLRYGIAVNPVGYIRFP